MASPRGAPRPPRTPCEPRRHPARGPSPSIRADQPVGQGPVAGARAGRVAPERVRQGRGEKRRLAPGEVAGGLAEIAPGGRLRPEDAVAPFGDVEIVLHHPPLRPDRGRDRARPAVRAPCGDRSGSATGRGSSPSASGSSRRPAPARPRRPPRRRPAGPPSRRRHAGRSGHPRTPSPRAAGGARSRRGRRRPALDRAAGSPSGRASGSRPAAGPYRRGLAKTPRSAHKTTEAEAELDDTSQEATEPSSVPPPGVLARRRGLRGRQGGPPPASFIEPPEPTLIMIAIPHTPSRRVWPRSPDRSRRPWRRLLSDEARPGEIARPARLIAAMRHAALGGGKRLRPFLVVETARLFGRDGTGPLRAGARARAAALLLARP